MKVETRAKSINEATKVFVSNYCNVADYRDFNAQKSKNLEGGFTKNKKILLIKESTFSVHLPKQTKYIDK